MHTLRTLTLCLPSLILTLSACGHRRANNSKYPEIGCPVIELSQQTLERPNDGQNNPQYALVRGRLTYKNKALTDAYVIALAEPGPDSLAHPDSEAFETRTDPRGEFSLQITRPGQYSIQLIHGEYKPCFVGVHDLQFGHALTLRFELERTPRSSDYPVHDPPPFPPESDSTQNR